MVIFVVYIIVYILYNMEEMWYILVFAVRYIVGQQLLMFAKWQDDLLSGFKPGLWAIGQV